MSFAPTKIVVIGTGRLARSCLELCLPYGLDLECIEPEEGFFSILSTFCKQRGVRYRCMDQKEEVGVFFRNVKVPTLVVSAYNGYIFPKSVLENSLLNIVNFHNSLLPRHRGRNAPTWTIFEEDPVTGITWHEVGTEIDTGKIIGQRVLAVGTNVTAIELTLQTLELGAQCFGELLPELLCGHYPSIAIETAATNKLHLSHEMPNGGIADCSWPVRKVYAFLRSMDYGKLKVFPSARVSVLGFDFEILSYSRTKAIGPSSCIAAIDIKAGQLTFQGDGHRLEVRVKL
jgi:methionyl-tRNA formyltransferase